MSRSTAQTLLNVLHHKKMGNTTVSFLMNEVRKLLEENEVWKRSFHVLGFYCDWCMHSKIDRNQHSETLIRDLNKSIWQLDDSGNIDPSKPMDVSGFFKIPQLLKELEIVLSAYYGELVFPTYTFIFALFNYLKEVPVVPIDALKGKLSKGSEGYNALCHELQISAHRPLLKNIEIIGYKSPCLYYRAEMDGVQSEVQGQVEFPICNDTPFVFILERNKEKSFEELARNAQQLWQMKRLDEASVCLNKMKSMASEIIGMDPLKAMMYHLAMEVEWARTGKVDVLADGEKALKYVAEIQTRCLICHNMTAYAIQKKEWQLAEQYLKEYLKNAQLAIFRASPLQMKGRLLFMQHQYDKAMKAYGQAAGYASQCHQEDLLIYIIWGMVDVLAAKGQYQTAISELTHAEQLANELKKLDIRVRTSMLKAQLLIKMGDEATALKVVEKIPQYND